METYTKNEIESILKLRRLFRDEILKEFDGVDVVVLHCPWDLEVFDGVNDKAVVLYEHRACRFATFMFDEIIKYVEPLRARLVIRDRGWVLQKHKELFKKADLIIVNSKFIQEQMLKWFGIETYVCYPPIDLRVFRPVKNPSRDFFLSAQRVNWQKRIDLQIDAFRGLKERLIIVGSPNEPEPNPTLVELAKDCPNIEILGGVKLKELVNLMANAKAVIQTGYYEDFGLVPVQALACGTPAIVVDEGGFRETIHSPKLGVRIKKPYLENLRKAVLEFDISRYDPKILREEAKKYGFTEFRKRFNKLLKLAVRKHEERYNLRR